MLERAVMWVNMNGYCLYKIIVIVIMIVGFVSYMELKCMIVIAHSKWS